MPFDPESDAVAEDAIGQLSRLGATVVDPADIPNVNDVFDPEFTVLLFEFKADMARYLSELTNTSMRTLADLIAFDDAHADQEMRWFGQEIFLLAEETDGLDDPQYLQALRTSKQLMQDGINEVLNRFDLHAIVSLTGSPSWMTDLVNGDHFLASLGTRDLVPRETEVRGGSGSQRARQAAPKASPARRNPVAGSL